MASFDELAIPTFKPPIWKFKGTTDDLGPVFNTTIGLTELWLAIQAFVLNTIVIAYYKNVVKKTVPFMYIMLAVCDLVTGVAALLNSCMFLILQHYKSTAGTMNPGVYLIVPTYAISSITFKVSVFLNLIVSVVRTVNIIQPFHRISKVVIGTSVLVYALAWTVFTVYQMVAVFAPSTPQYSDLENYMYRPAQYQVFQHGDNVTVNEEFRNLTLMITLPYLLPSLTVLVCMGIQVWAILKPNQVRSSASDPANQRQITITILMLTVLFFVCNTVYVIYPVIFYKKYIQEEEKPFGLEGVEQLRLQYCFGVLCPYINAAFNPAILIWRGKEISRSVKIKLEDVRASTLSLISISKRKLEPGARYTIESEF